MAPLKIKSDACPGVMDRTWFQLSQLLIRSTTTSTPQLLQATARLLPRFCSSTADDDEEPPTRCFIQVGSDVYHSSGDVTYGEKDSVLKELSVCTEKCFSVDIPSESTGGTSVGHFHMATTVLEANAQARLGMVAELLGAALDQQQKRQDSGDLDQQQKRQDAAARRETETERRRLKETQQIARLGQWELDLTTNSLYWSDEIYSLFRVDKEQFGASYEAFLNAIHPDDRDMVNEAYTNSLKTKQSYEITHRLLFENNEVRWVNEICRTEYDEVTGEPLLSIGAVQDITELQQIQEDLRAAKERAEEADRLKSTFLANMSHEIRTPMNAIIGYTDLLLSDSHQLSNIHHEYLDIIKNSGNLLLTLIGDILDVSKIEAGQMRVSNKPFSVQDVLKTVYANAKGLLTRKRNGVTDDSGTLELRPPLEFGLEGGAVDGSEPSDWVMGDEARIQQVLLNLLSNAIKFSDDGYVAYSARVVQRCSSSAGDKQAHMIEFRVQDTGMGIPPAEQENIFRPFGQATGTVDHHVLGGTGLGLAIARRLVQLMGGEMHLESRHGQHNHGSTFSFTIPYKPTNHSQPRKIQRALSNHPMSSESKESDRLSGKVLLVDDSRVNLLLAERVIVKMGCSSVTATNGSGAVSLFQQDPTINLILMDKEMPELSGIEATREIRRIEKEARANHTPGTRRRRRIPIIALTAAAMSGDREECLTAGCNDYLSKPLNREKLYDLLTFYLKGG